MSKRRGRGAGSIYLSTCARTAGGSGSWSWARPAAEGTLVVSERTMVEQFLTSWLETVRATVRPGTWRRYEQYRSGAACEAHAGAPSAAVRGSADGGGVGAVRGLHRTLHRALVVMLRVTRPQRGACPRVERPEIEPLSPEEARRLLDAVKGDRLEALYVVALTTGLRRGELSGLRWSDVDLGERVLRVRRSLQVDHDGRWGVR